MVCFAHNLNVLFSSSECEHDEFMHVSERIKDYYAITLLGLFSIQLLIYKPLVD